MDKQFVRLATRDDIPFMDGVANEPSVRPFVMFGDHHVSFTPSFDGSISYVSEHGLIFLQGISDTTAMALVAFKPEGRGTHAMLAMRDALRMIFCETQYTRVIGTIDASNIRMVRALPILGFNQSQLVGDRVAVGAEFMPWAIYSPECVARGHAFSKENGIDLGLFHNTAGAMGGFLIASEAGLVTKGVEMFNTYAMLSQTEPIRIVGDADRIFYKDKELTELVLMTSGA